MGEQIKSSLAVDKRAYSWQYNRKNSARKKMTELAFFERERAG